MGTNGEITVLLADDHPVVLHGLQSLLSRRPELKVVATATDGPEAVAAVLSTRPTVAVLDLRMPGCDGLEATKRILAEFPEARIIILSGAEEPSMAVDAFRAGAIGFLPKASFAKFLVEGIQLAAEGKAVVTAELVTRLVQTLRDQPAQSPLNEREQEIVPLIAEGMTNEQIARQLGLSVSSVKAQLTSLFDKLGATDRASALAVCFRRGWLT
jgi:DNA-binding NarL/FixJ family response regulator